MMEKLRGGNALKNLDLGDAYQEEPTPDLMTLVIDEKVATGYVSDGFGRGREAVGLDFARDQESDRIFVTKV